MKNIMLLCLIVLLSISNAMAEQRNVWFSPTNSDLLNSDANNSKWDKASKVVSEFKFYHGLIRNIPDDILVEKVNTLNSLGIKVSVELPILVSDVQSKNGKFIEGFHNKTYIEYLMKKLKRLNIPLNSVVIDESLYFGFYKNNNDENYKDNVNAIVQNSKFNLDIIRKYYPNVSFSIIEPVQLFRSNDFYKIFDLYKNEMLSQNKVKIDSVQDDIFWNKFNSNKLVSIAKLLGKNNVDFGIVINSSENAKNDNDWVRSANNNLDILMKTGVFKMNNVYPIFQSWNSYPQNTLPENSPDTQTHSIIMYNEMLKK